MRQDRLRFIIGLVILLYTLLAAGSSSLWAGELHRLSYEGDIEGVKRELAKKPNPDERDSFGGTALHAAMFQANMEILALLIDYGLDVNAQGTSNGYTPLHDAVWSDNLPAVIFLIERGADQTIKAKDGLTPLDKARKENKTKIVEYLEITAENDS